MAKTKFIRVRCLHCRAWFPSPIFFGDSESFDTAIIFGNVVRCSKCGQVTGCNPENFHARFEDGGFIGADVDLDE